MVVIIKYYCMIIPKWLKLYICSKMVNIIRYYKILLHDYPKMVKIIYLF